MPSVFLYSLICNLVNANYPGNSVIDNTKWLDINGDYIHAHGGEIYEFNNTFYWIGSTEKMYFPSLNVWLSEGINCYSSNNLMDWKYENTILYNTSIIITDNNDVSPPWRVEKPKILYNQQNKNFVLWFHVDTASFSLTSVGIAINDNMNNPCADYKWIDSFEPNGLKSYDMSLYQQDNIAYLTNDVGNQYIGISQLNDNYTNVSDSGIIGYGPRIEGSTVFLLSTYYMMGSHLSGWAPNPAELCTSNRNDSLVNITWTNVVNGQCPNPTNSSKSYNSQITTVERYQDDVNGKYTFMYMSDIWNYPNLTEATYLWLPIDFQGNNSAQAFPFIPYLETWKLSDYAIDIP